MPSHSAPLPHWPVMFLLLALCLAATSTPLQAEAVKASHSRPENNSELMFLTEHYPPYNFEQNKEFRGISVDLLEQLTQLIQYPLNANNLRLLPWTRAYRIAEQQKNTVLFTTTRTPQREDLFHWVGPITQSRIVLMARKDSGIKINNIEQLSQYRVGAIRDDIAEQQLRHLGMKESSFHHVSHPEYLAKMLAHKRIDLWAYDENVARWLLKQQGSAISDFESVYTLTESGVYFAFNKDSDPQLIQRFRQGFKQLEQRPGLISAIIAKYL